MATVNDMAPGSREEKPGGRAYNWARALWVLPRLERRIEELEAAVVELRRVERRMAELTDVMVEVLLPADTRNEGEVRRLLDAYLKRL